MTIRAYCKWRGAIMARLSRLTAMWKAGAVQPGSGPVHVSMNDYLVRRWRDIPMVALAGLRLRRRWPQTEGALGLWVASFRYGRRQVSVSIWRCADDLRGFVRSQEHTRIMREFRDVECSTPTPGRRSVSMRVRLAAGRRAVDGNDRRNPSSLTRATARPHAGNARCTSAASASVDS